MTERVTMLSDIALAIGAPLIGDDRPAQPQDFLCAHGLIMYGPGKVDCPVCAQGCEEPK